MALRKSHLRQALSLMVRTRPFLAARLAVYGVFFFATVGYTATFVLLLHVYSNSTLGQLLVLAVAAGLYLLARRYLGRHLTYAGHAPHVQAMVEALKGQPLARGNAQIEAATRQVDERFPETSKLFQLEALVGRVLREVRDVVIQPGQLRPLPGFQKLGRVGALLARLSLKNVEKAVFGYTLWAAKPNIWQSARRGLLIFAQSAASVTTSALRIFLSGLLFGGLLIVLWLWPGSKLLSWGWNEGGLMFLIVLIGFVKAAWVAKTALYDPIGLAWMLSIFVRKAEETSAVDADWVEKLGRASKRFREIGDRAKAFDAAEKPQISVTDGAKGEVKPGDAKAGGPPAASPKAGPPPGSAGPPPDDDDGDDDGDDDEKVIVDL